ncbi:MAG: sigma-70 family RNA polymerase sigma factor [Planctomycetota bacterium]|nr:sigma-70 family RNA polymerase sigma factor [Planctomycetota bacterium]
MVRRARTPKTPNPTLQRLWDEFRNKGCLNARNALVEFYRGHASRVAHRVKARLPRSVDVGDLTSAGDVGLIQSIQSFDPSRGVPFEAFCAHRVRGAIIDELRRHDWLPRPMRNRLNRRKEMESRLRHEFGREPKEHEIAEGFDLSLEEFHTQFGNDQEAPVLAGGKPVSDSSSGEHGLDFIEDLREEGPVEPAHRREMLHHISATLNEESREILFMRFFEGRTLQEMGDALGISPSRVSKILARILARLKERFEDKVN